MNFQIVRPDQIDAVWPMVCEGLGMALVRSGGDWGLSDLLIPVRSSMAFLMVAYDKEIAGAAVFKPETWQVGPRMRILALYGDDFKTWRDEFMEAGRSFARLLGMDTFVFDGRSGHTKLFPEARVIRQVYEVK